MKTYHNDPAVKSRLISQLEAHAAADEIVKGDYWKRGKGCAIGCTVHSDDHNLYPEMWGLPVWLAHLEDRIFEGLPNAEAKEFPLQFARSIPVGVDMDPVRHKFLSWLMEDNLKRVKSLDIPAKLKAKVTAAIVTVRDLHAAESTDESAWEKARAVARAVAARMAEEEKSWKKSESDAEAAVEAAASAGAWAARDAAAVESAEWAADSASSSEAWAEAAEVWMRYRDELLKLLADAK